MGTKNNLEIERKFLLKRVPALLAKDIKIYLIHQIYVEIDGQITRFRMTEDLRNRGNNQATYVKCIKKPISTGVFEEIEVEVSENTFDKMVKQPHRFIIKERWVYSEDGLKWEIDKYDDINLVTLEVELDDINQEIEIPEKIKKEIICEVTGQKPFSNYSLSEEG